MAKQEEKGLWDRILEKVGANQAEAAPDPKRNAFVNPAAKNAQGRATGYYFRTGQDRPLDDFINDPNLK